MSEYIYPCIPKDMYKIIIRFTDGRDFCNCFMVCKEFCRICCELKNEPHRSIATQIDNRSSDHDNIFLEYAQRLHYEDIVYRLSGIDKIYAGLFQDIIECRTQIFDQINRRAKYKITTKAFNNKIITIVYEYGILSYKLFFNDNNLIKGYINILCYPELIFKLNIKKKTTSIIHKTKLYTSRSGLYD